MTTPSKQGAACFAIETNFAENTPVFGTRAPILDAVDLSGFDQTKLVPANVVQGRNEGVSHIKGPMVATFKLKFYWTGHGSATSGATALTTLGTILKLILGGGQASSASGTTCDTGSAADDLTTIAANGFAAGSLLRVGTGGIGADGRANGQWAVVEDHSSNDCNLLTALPGAPNSGDVVHSSEVVFLADEIKSSRWLLQTAGQQIEAHGCYPTGITISNLNAGQLVTIDVDMAAAWWKPAAATFPTATAFESGGPFQPAPVGGGSFFLQPVGTATRATRNVRDVQISIKLGVAALPGPNGVHESQTIVGVCRTMDEVSLTFTEDAEAATTTPALAAIHDSSTKYHCLYGWNTTAGAAGAFYFPSLCVMGKKPTQQDRDGINSTTIQFAAYQGPNTNTDLAKSSFRGALA